MNVVKSRSSAIVVFLAILFLIPLAESISFNFSSFRQNTGEIFYQGDAFSAGGVIQVTKNQLDSSLIQSVGRASYSHPIRIWDRRSRHLTDFTSHFSFIINALDAHVYGHGLCFFLAPFDSEIPPNSTDGFLGLFSHTSTPTPTGLVAVEFDTFKDPWDPSSDHVGININSIVSVTNVTWKSSMKNGSRANAWVTYNSSTKNLSVFLTYTNNPTFNGNSSSLSYIVDLRDVLPEWVRVGFSAATGNEVELHTILTWNFHSTLEEEEKQGKGKNRLVIISIFGSLLLLLACFLCLFWFVRRKKWTKWLKKQQSIDFSMEEDFQRGPKRFTFEELNEATNNFAEEGKLGEGGFGSVYLGILRQHSTKVAVKRVSRGSKQGQKEYSSEVKIISRLRHKNLVQLMGWCHEGQGELILVYEFLTNGSLDSHLFGRKSRLPWPIRYKIAQGLASGLLYLHEEWEQCVVHRDVKSSNLMLDANYNAKLGDFGLARLVDHELGSQTTVLAGTMGYLAPECVTTGKASRKSDVYSFGVVCLEIACGRQAIDLKAETGQIRLVEYVWELYGNGKLEDAIDKRLLFVSEVECLMVVGLWCCHPDQDFRPSMRQVINVLNFEAPLPCLPLKQPVPIYFAPPMNMCKFSYTSTTAADSDNNKCSSSCSSSVSAGAGSSNSLLQSHTTPM